MPIDVICDNCFESYRVKDERAGSTLKCKNCGKPLQVPTGTMALSLPQRRSTTTKPTKSSTQNNSSQPPWLLIGGGVGGVVLVIVVILLFAGGGDDRAGGNGPGAGAAPGEGVASDGQSPNGGWLVKPDPPAEVVQFPAGQPVAIPIPDGAAQDWAIYPETPSAFVAVGSNFRPDDTREIWDLRTGQKVGTVQTDIGPDHGALSPDGKYFTGMSKSKDKLLLFDTVQGKQIVEIPIGAGTISPQTCFAGNSKLVTLRRKQPLKVWEIPSGKELASIELPKFIQLYSLTVSPGGRYAALVVKDDESGKQVLRIFDLAEGQLAGELNLDTFIESSSTSCECLIFSPDGQELAGVFKNVGSTVQSWLVAWKLNEGKVAFKHQFASALENQAHSGTNESPDARWFPDQQWLLLFGRYIFDRESGGPIWTLPKDPELTGSETTVLTNDQMLVVSGPYKQRKVVSVPLDPSQIAMSAAAVEAGGLAEDAGLPPLTNFDATTGTAISLTENAAVWNVTIEASSTTEQAVDIPVPLESEYEPIESLFVPRENSHQALIARYKSEQESRVQVVSLADSAESREIVISFSTRMIAVSPDGSQILTRIKGSESRLDLWSSADGKHLVGWRPFQGEGDKLDKITAAGFTDNSHLLTLSSGRKLVMWEIPSVKKLYTIEDVNQSRNLQQTFVDTIASQNLVHEILSGIGSGNRTSGSTATAAQPLLNPGLPAISPGGSTLAIQDTDRLQFVDAITGKLTGTVSIQGPLSAAAFDPQGKKFAALMLRPAGGALITINLTDGSIADEIPLPIGGTWLHWCNQNHVLIDHQFLVDLEHRKIVWSYEPTDAYCAEKSPGNRLWGIFLRDTTGSDRSLAAVSLPTTDQAKQLAGKIDPPKYVMSPGSRVTVQYNLQAKPPGDAGFEGKIRAQVSALLGANGLTEQAGSKIVLQISTSTTSTGRQMEFTKLGGQDSTKTLVTENQIVCTLKFQTSGKEIWSTESEVSNLKFGLTRIKPGESIENHLKQQQWESVEKLFSSIAIPAFLFSESDLKDVGRSVLTAE